MAVLDTNKIISWFDMEEESGNRADSHGTATLVDENTVLFTANGKPGNAADFDDTNSEYFSTTDDADFTFLNVNFAFCGWVYPSDISANYVLSKLDGDEEYSLRFHDADGLRFQILSATDTSSTFIPKASLSTNTWYFFYIYHDADNDVIGINLNDGALTDEDAHNTGSRDTGSNFEVGRHTAGSELDGYLDGLIALSDVLTAPELTWLYNAGDGRAYSELSGFIPTSTGIF